MTWACEAWSKFWAIHGTVQEPLPRDAHLEEKMSVRYILIEYILDIVIPHGKWFEGRGNIVFKQVLNILRYFRHIRISICSISVTLDRAVQRRPAFWRGTLATLTSLSSLSWLRRLEWMEVGWSRSPAGVDDYCTIRREQMEVKPGEQLKLLAGWFFHSGILLLKLEAQQLSTMRIFS